MDPRVPTNFHCFSRLPLELRCEIWKASMEPRVVEISYELPDGFYSNARLPEALTVCRESRNTLLPFYRLCFGTIFHPAKTRFNFDLDTLYIDNAFEEDVPHLFSALRGFELKGLKYVALDSYFNGSDSHEDFQFVAHLKRAMRCLEALKELQIVFDIQVLSERTLGCGQEDHTMEIHDTLPKELQIPELKISPLPEDVDFDQFDMWKSKKVKPVYGWRRCPVGLDSNEWEEGSDSDLVPWGIPDTGHRFWEISDDSDGSTEPAPWDVELSDDSSYEMGDGASAATGSGATISQAGSLD
jgi:hypothetical protein